MAPGFLLVVAAPDPVAALLADLWGTPPATGAHVDGAPIRLLAPGVELVRRPGWHVTDERLDVRLPPKFRDEGWTLVFPSVHRSEQNVECLTVHPLGNPVGSAEVGGRTGTVNPTDPRRMTDALRRLTEGASALGLPATFEATHHGPELALPSFFVEIGFGARPGPTPEAVALLARVLPELTPDPADRVAVGAGGGHYAPHFTELALERRWAFGHLLSRHALETVTAATVRAALDATPGHDGVVFARARDAELAAFESTAVRRLRDAEAPARERALTRGARSTSGT